MAHTIEPKSLDKNTAPLLSKVKYNVDYIINQLAHVTKSEFQPNFEVNSTYE